MNIETIEAIRATLSKLNHIKGAAVLTIDDSGKQGNILYKCQIKVPLGRESLLVSLEKLSLIIGSLNGEGLSHEIDNNRRILFLS